MAWKALGWWPVAFSEIAPFPCAVLSHHYPDVPNLGDMAEVDGRLFRGVDLLVGGTPCQEFSIAGKRSGLEGARSGLAREFVRILEEAGPRWFVWENVPGVLSVNGGRDFGKLLTEMGERGYGLAWRVLNASFFGVPQHRRRVYVIGYFGDWRPAAEVLFERESLQGDIAQGGEARKEAPGAVEGSVVYAPRIVAQAMSSKWSKGTSGPAGDEHHNLVVDRRGVRRLTPRECERLQGFPDDYTLVPWRGKPVADNARYKALGNAMPVPVMRWIGRRIQEQEDGRQVS